MLRLISRLIEPVFINSPLSRLGCNIATAIGLMWAAPLSTGAITRHGDLIVCQGLPRWAFRRGGVCVGRVFITRGATSPAVIRHELVHVAQWRKYGLLFPVLYALAGSDPLRNRFEIEAGLADGGYVRR
ncbi:Fe-S oxidoreductase [uncultured Gulosibacter sp.]|uniref:Fe-S oxidoreductase n=1 Tax=uncultured Gulosibacter sp. TaxID=1339167 RepID=UPI00288B51CD|nr:Fe-S oxidoreductase [uncultured Gulosibacter sp.]